MSEKTGKTFLEESYYGNMAKTDQAKGLPQPSLELPCEGERIALPPMDEVILPEIALEKAIINRTSIRKYDAEPLNLKTLSYALYATQGVKSTLPQATLRTVPSAGARHAFETIILINRVDGLEPGLYRYMATEHALVKRPAPKDIAMQMAEACLGQTMVAQAAVTFLWFADPYRMIYRYGERGYRYLFLDAGHVMQNLYLVAEQIDCGSCAIAAYDDQAVNALLDLDGDKYFTIYIGTLGKKLPDAK